MNNHTTTPVIAIDGPSASGKGTVAQRVARMLGYHYRLVALAAKQSGISWQDAAGLGTLAMSLNIVFQDNKILLNDQDVSDEVRSEEMGKGASEVAVHPEVRSALLALQHSFRKAPGLVADGRDMGSVVFPDATTKIFLTASTEIRAERRYKQLIEKGKHANLQDILYDLQLRDARDSQRASAPLLQCQDAILLETSERSIEEAVEFVIQAAKKSFV